MAKTDVPSYLLALTQLVRLFMSLTLGLAAIAGAHLAGPTNLPASTALVLFAVGVLTAAGGFSLNDIQDQDRDRSALTKPLVRGIIKRNTAFAVSMSCLVLALILSGTLGSLWFLLSCAQIALLATYSNLKRWSGFSANIITALLCTSGICYGSLLGKPSALLLAILAASFLFVLGREVLKDILDAEDDKLAGVKTLPNSIGIISASFIATGLGLVATGIAIATMVFAVNGNQAVLGIVIFSATALVLVWNTAVRTRRSLSWALHSTAFAMLAAVLISIIPT